jgi:hypothetical protein
MHSAFALDVLEGTVLHEDGYLVIDSSTNGNELNVAGTLEVATALIIGNDCYDTRAEVLGTGLIDADSIYLGSGSVRGCSLIILGGGVVQASSFNISGDQTEGVAYPHLQNYVSVSGQGSRLEVSGQLNIWSPDAPGQPGDSYDIPRELPAYLVVENGAEVEVDSLSIANGSWLSIGSGGKLSIHSDYDASDGHIHQMADGTLSIGGELSGLSTVEAGQRIEAASVLGNLNVDGVLSIGNDNSAGSIQGNLVISESGTLELSTRSGITVSGQATLGGKLSVKFDEEDPVLSAGDQIQLFNFEGGVTGSFDSVDPLSSDGSLAWDLSELNTAGVLHVIPEPATLTLVGVGGLMLASRRRKSGKSNSSYTANP